MMTRDSDVVRVLIVIGIVMMSGLLRMLAS